MLLLKSLFCLKGHDNGRRFLVISGISYLLLLLLLPILPAAGVLLALLFLTVSPILMLAAMRRIHDAHLATPLALIPLVVYWLNLFGLSYFQHGAKWVLLILAIIISLAFAALNNIRIRKNANYRLGYSGPVNLEPEPQEVSPLHRVEPTLEGQPVSEPISQDPLEFESAGQDSLTSNFEQQHPEGKQAEWVASFNRILSKKPKLVYSIAGVGLFIILAIASIPLFDEETPEQQVAQQQTPEVSKQRLNKVEMPDAFWVMLDQYDALTIAWEGDLKSEQELGKNGLYWSAATAEGDKDCVSVDFTLGEKLRTIRVTVKNGGDYYADFSPVDTKVIVESIANKDRFKLCGYEFTLKGTRSILRKNQKYRSYFDS